MFVFVRQCTETVNVFMIAIMCVCNIGEAEDNAEMKAPKQRDATEDVSQLRTTT